MRLVQRVTWRHVSLFAALALVAQSEWQLALMVGWPAYIAWAAPVALDAYVLAAVRTGRDLGASVLVSAASVFGSHALHAWSLAGGRPAWWLTGAASAVPLLVTWRVHHLPQEPSWPSPAPTAVQSARPVGPAAPAAQGPAVRPPARTAGDVGTPAVAATRPTPTRPAATPPAPPAGGPAPTPPSAPPSPTPPDQPGTDPAPVDRASAVTELAAMPVVPGPTEIAYRYRISARSAARWRADALRLHEQRTPIGARP